MEGLALTGAWVDKEKGLLSMIVLEMGGSSRLVAGLQPGEPVVVMGPTGTPTEILKQESVLLCGGGLGNAVLFSIAKALREQGCRVLYFAAYKKKEDIYKVEEIEAGTDQVIWSVDIGDLPATRRPQDRAFRGNVVQAMNAYARGELGEVLIPLATCSRIIAIGSDRMMAAVKDARHGQLAAAPEPRSRRHRVDQLAHAVHDERDLRAVPAAPRRSRDRPRVHRLQLHQPGPAARQRRLEKPGRPPAPEHRAGKADRPLGRAVAGDGAVANARGGGRRARTGGEMDPSSRLRR